MALQDWLEETYRDHAPALFRFLIRLTGDDAETRDLLQDIFVRLARSPRMWEGVDAPRSYLFRLAHRLFLDRHRREETRQRYDDLAWQERETIAAPEPLPEDLAWVRETLAASLQSLPPEQRAVVLLKIHEEMTFAEIAAALDLSAHTAASRYRYALDKLRRDLRPLQRELP